VTRGLKLGGQALALAAVAGMLALLVWRIVNQHHAPKVGATAPAFDLRRLGREGSLGLASLHGRPVVLNFWASWCGPCKAEATVLERAWNDFRGRGVVVLGVDYHDVTSDAMRFVAAHRLTFPMVQDGSGDITDNDYGISAVPETYVIGKTGRIVLHIPGPITSGALVGQLREAVREALRS
jgi:cytochrome c biogenesis protein CcmG/thiol:disulfide interchange protein DsbE